MTFLFKHNEWWKAGVAVVLFMIATVLIQNEVAAFEELSGGEPLIELPNLAGENLYDIATLYSDEALESYQYRVQPLDVIYPLTAGVMFFLTLNAFTTRLFPEDSNWRYVPILGLLATLLDWGENLCVFVILRTLENPIDWLSPLTSGFTMIKTIMGMICIILILGMFILWVYRKVRQ